MKRIVVLIILLITIPLQVKFITWHEAERQFLKYQQQYTWIDKDIKKIMKLDRYTYDLIKSECERQGFYLHVALAFAFSESRFKHKVVSSAGAVGIFQIMPKQHRLSRRKLFNPVYNTKHGVRILKMYYLRANRNMIRAAKFYNAGPAGKKFTGWYIMEICHNVATSKPDTPAIELLSL